MTEALFVPTHHLTVVWRQYCEWSSLLSPHPVSCQCPGPTDYCTLAPESDVPEEWKMKKGKKKQKTHIIFTTPAIFSGMVTEAADAFRYSHCISILLEYRWAAKIHRAACQGDSWQICMFWFRFHQLLKADTDIPLFLDWRWWQMIFLPIFSTFKFSYINAKGNFKKFCGKMAPSQWGFSIFTMENLGVAFRHLI